MSVTILTSGIGLGVYMPALLIRDQLLALDAPAEIEVLEGYFTSAGQQAHLAHKQAYHDNFDLALMAHRMARGVESSLDHARVEELLDRWAAERRSHFIVWSGFWLPILERYRSRAATELSLDRCRIDAVISASFRAHEGLATDAPEIWLWNWDERRTMFEIHVDERPHVPFAQRDKRLVVHGGGWGLGSYRDAATALSPTWACDVVVHAATEASQLRGSDRAYMVAPEWRAWHRGNDGHGYPPFGEVGGAMHPGGHALYELIRRSRAIISKPGGGTLIDSLSSATPVVLLEPYGYAEAKNGALWEELGYGISYAKWRDEGFSMQRLEQLHENLVRRKDRGPSYPHHYADRLRARHA